MTARESIPVGGTSNLDNAPDPHYKYKGEKSSMDLPPSGMDGQIVVNPNNQWYDQATRSKKVSLAAIVFHELAEAFLRFNLGFHATGKMAEKEHIFGP